MGNSRDDFTSATKELLANRLVEDVVILLAES